MKFEIGEYRKRECSKSEFIDHHQTMLRIYLDEKGKAKKRHEKELAKIEKKMDIHIEAIHAAENAQERKFTTDELFLAGKVHENGKPI